MEEISEVIPVDLFDCSTNRLDYKLVSFVNKNLKAIVEVFIDYLNESDGIDVSEKLIEVLPRDYVVRKPDECRRLVDELYEIISSPAVRGYIKPKYEYLLFHIIYRWKEVCDDGLQELSLPVKLNDELKAEILSNQDYASEDDVRNFVIETIGDLEEYLYICFPDHDFLPNSLDKLVSIYLRSPDFLEAKYPDVNLDDYIDLMTADLRELYLEKKQELTKLTKKDYDIVQDQDYKVVIELYSAISLLQNHIAELQTKNEVQISNEIFRMLKRLFKRSFDMEIEREAQIGRARVVLGETDFAIYYNGKYYQNIAIVESKSIEKFLNEYRQLLGYLNPSFKFGVTLSINRDKPLDVAFKYIKDKLESINDDDFRLMSIRLNPFGDEFKYIIKSEHILPEDSSRTMCLYHMIINFNDQARQRIAEESRQK